MNDPDPSSPLPGDKATPDAENLFAVALASKGGDESFPVLRAFQSFLDQERERARRRMTTLSICFITALVLLVVVFGVLFAVFFGHMLAKSESQQDRLLELASRGLLIPPAAAPAAPGAPAAPVVPAPAAPAPAPAAAPVPAPAPASAKKGDEPVTLTRDQLRALLKKALDDQRAAIEAGAEKTPAPPPKGSLEDARPPLAPKAKPAPRPASPKPAADRPKPKPAAKPVAAAPVAKPAPKPSPKEASAAPKEVPAVPAEPVAPKPAPAAEPVRTESIRVRNLATNAVPDGYSTDRFWVQTPNGVRFQFRSLVPVPDANVK